MASSSATNADCKLSRRHPAMYNNLLLPLMYAKKNKAGRCLPSFAQGAIRTKTEVCSNSLGFLDRCFVLSPPVTAEIKANICSKICICNERSNVPLDEVAGVTAWPKTACKHGSQHPGDPHTRRPQAFVFELGKTCEELLQLLIVCLYPDSAALGLPMLFFGVVR